MKNIRGLVRGTEGRKRQRARGERGSKTRMKTQITVKTERVQREEKNV